MNAYLNYLLEASIGLCLFLLVYQLVLRKETNFRLNRIFLLVAIIASVTFPLLKFNTVDSPVPSLNFSVVTSENVTNLEPVGESIDVSTSYSTWEILAIVYTAGLTCFLIVFAIRLAGMMSVLKQSTIYKINDHNIVELKSKDSPFSFFNFIFIGNTPPLTENEKQQIIAHESIHAKLYHSFDIVLLNILGIVFWFNPLIRIYKKIFVQLHEFEADARAVENHDVNEYCTLLAKVALHSADYKLANHFSNSLTIKRIEMMRTLKQKIQSWKVVAVAAFLPILFFVVSCQDQVEAEVKYIEKPFILPASVQETLSDLGEKYPNDYFVFLPPSNVDPKVYEEQTSKLVASANGKDTYTADAIIAIDAGDRDAEGKKLMWIIFQYKDGLKPITKDKTATDEKYREIDARPVYYAVEKQAIPIGGIDAFVQRLKQNIKYPASAKQAGIEGRVFIKFIVWSDGKISSFEILKGINQEINLEALRVLKLETQQAWTPGMQNGMKVNSQFVLPIEFKLQ